MLDSQPQIPSTWEHGSIGSFAEINPRRPKCLGDLPEDYQVSFVPMGAVCEKAGAIFDSEIKAFSDVRKGYTYFEEGDVIFAKITPCMQNGKAAVASGLSNGLGFGSTEFHVLRPGPKVCPEWLYYFVRQGDFRKEAKMHFRGSAGQQRVPQEFLADHVIPIPPLEEQRRIVARIQECLSRVEEMERLQAEVAEDATHVTGRFLYQEFSSIAEGSPSVLIDDVTKDSRYGTNNKCSEEPSGTPILRIPNVANGYVNTENLKYCSLGEKEYQKVGLQPGDLLVVRTNGSPDLVGRCAVFREDSQFGFASYLIRFRLDQAKVLPEYLSFFLQSPGGRTAIAGIRKTSAGQFNVNSENLRGISFPLPDLDTQERLIERAKQVQMMSGEMAEDYSRDTAALRNAILRQAFAGEL